MTDITAAEVLNEDADFAQWTRAKGCDTFGCIGPMIATEFDGRKAHLVTRLDGVGRRDCVRYVARCQFHEKWRHD